MVCTLQQGISSTSEYCIAYNSKPTKLGYTFSSLTITAGTSTHSSDNSTVTHAYRYEKNSNASGMISAAPVDTSGTWTSASYTYVYNYAAYDYYIKNFYGTVTITANWTANSYTITYYQLTSANNSYTKII